MKPLNIPITCRDGVSLPQYQTEGSAGLDLTAAIDSAITLKPGERHLVPTGISIALPIGYEAQVRARSGLAIKHGITIANGIGTIDTDYRGEIQAIVINHGQDAFTIEPGMRVAQLVIAQYNRVVWQHEPTLDKTDRADKGFGSSGF